MKVQLLLGLLLVFTQSSHVQTLDVDNEPTKPLVSTVQPPEDIRNWTPEKNQFQLYINTLGSAKDVVPRIDVLTKNGSWPFKMQYTHDTVYVFIVPPGYKFTERTSVDNLPNEFPLVVWAGTGRAVYGFSYDSGKVTVDTLQAAPFISLIGVSPIPANVLCWQLQGSGQSAAAVKSILSALDKQAKLIQLPEGYYRGEWLFISETTIRKWKLNETATGTLLALELADTSTREAVHKQLRAITK